MNNDTEKIELVLRTISEMNEIGSSNDTLSQLIDREKYSNGRELSEEDLDYVAAATANPNYKKFIEFVLGKEKK